MNALPNACSKQPPLTFPQSAAVPGPSEQSGCFVVDLVGLGDGWTDDANLLHASAVVTVAWVRRVAVVVVLLTHGKGRVALVLDPSDGELAKAVNQWRASEAMKLVHCVGEAQRTLELPVHVDGVVDAGLMAFGLKQGRTAFALAIEDYSVVEAALGRLADTWRISWALSKPRPVT